MYIFQFETNKHTYDPSPPRISKSKLLSTKPDMGSPWLDLHPNHPTSHRPTLAIRWIISTPDLSEVAVQWKVLTPDFFINAANTSDSPICFLLFLMNNFDTRLVLNNIGTLSYLCHSMNGFDFWHQISYETNTSQSLFLRKHSHPTLAIRWIILTPYLSWITLTHCLLRAINRNHSLNYAIQCN